MALHRTLIVYVFVVEAFSWKFIKFRHFAATIATYDVIFP